MSLPPEELSKLGIVRANASALVLERFASGHKELDDFLEGGLPIGCISEWGVPLGLGTRHLILQYLAAASKPGALQEPYPILWIYPATALCIFPPVLAACGVDLRNIGFVRTNDPVRDLKPVFLESFYRIIIFDRPAKLSPEDLAFVARQARMQNIIILVLRNYFLQKEQGNVWAHLRVNGRRDPVSAKHLKLEVIRGLSPRCRSIPLETLMH